MTPEERASVIAALVRLPRLDAELTATPLRAFLPHAGQRRALRRDTLIVLGDRGAGKTALFRLVNNAGTSAKLRAFYEEESIPEGKWIDAFSQEGMKHPEVGPMEVRAARSTDVALRAFWMTHLLRRIHEEVPVIGGLSPAVADLLKIPVADVDAYLPLAEANLGAVGAGLDAAERVLMEKGQTVVATYDNLDRLAPYSPEVRRRYIGTLLSLWLSLSNRYQKLRGKIFLRDDLFNGGELGFADAGKLRMRAEGITWDREALYRMVVRYLAAASEPVRAWLGEVRGLVLRDRGEFGWVPGEMSEDVQRAFMTKLTGRVLGKGVIKSETHSWVVNRVWDAHQRVTPRVMLWFFGFAGEAAERRTYRGRKAPLIADDLVEAIHRTSRERVEEIKEEYPGAVRMENLRGMKLPLRREDIARKLSKPRQEELPGLPTNGEAILGELLRCGVIRPGEDGKLDVPDIYRYAFGITPDYATAWEDFLLEDKPAARETLVRDLADLRGILRAHVAGKWGDVAKEAIERKDYVAAKEQCERALDLARIADDAGAEYDVFMRLASIEAELQGKREWFVRALDAAKRAKDKSRQADVSSALGFTVYDLGDADAAASALQESVRISREMNDSERETWALLGFSMVVRNSDPVGSAKSAVRAWALAQRASSKEQEMYAFERLCLLAEDDAEKHPFRPLLAAVLELLAEQVKDERLSGVLPKILHLPLHELTALRQQAAQAYTKDHGWNVIREAFPEVPLPQR